MQERKDSRNLAEQGFTLIELLVVIAILGVLAAVVVFSVNGITDRGKTSACKTEASTVQTALEAFDAKNGGYPAGTGLGGGLAALNVMTSPPDKFLNAGITALSPTQVAPTPYVYAVSGARFSVKDSNGAPMFVFPTGSYVGNCTT